MNASKLRRQIAYEAARAMYFRHESEYYRAKQKAAQRLCKGWVKPADLPSNAEIRDEIQTLARLHEGSARVDNLLHMRLTALRVMRMLERFRPRLIGSVMTGHIRQGSDIDLHVFSDSLEAVTHTLDEHMLFYDVERKRVKKDGEERIFKHVHLKDTFPIELTIYAANQAHTVFKSSITGKPIERASIAQLEQLIARDYPDVRIDASLAEIEDQPDRFQVFASLLLPLENVKQNPKYHPEGDALYHSLQVYDLACDQSPYDEEFLLAALLHDVGKAIDKDNHVQAGLEALDGFISERTRWLIESHMDAHKIFDGSLGIRAKRRLQQHESFQELLLLCQCDQAGRALGVETSDLDGALDYIRHLEHAFG